MIDQLIVPGISSRHSHRLLAGVEPHIGLRFRRRRGTTGVEGVGGLGAARLLLQQQSPNRGTTTADLRGPLRRSNAAVERRDCRRRCRGDGPWDEELEQEDDREEEEERSAWMHHDLRGGVWEQREWRGVCAFMRWRSHSRQRLLGGKEHAENMSLFLLLLGHGMEES